MDQYLIIKTMVDIDENISTEAILKYKKFEAEVEFHGIIDKFYEEIDMKYNVELDKNREALRKEYGDIVRGKHFFEFKDFEGYINFRVELKRL